MAADSMWCDLHRPGVDGDLNVRAGRFLRATEDQISCTDTVAGGILFRHFAYGFAILRVDGKHSLLGIRSGLVDLPRLSGYIDPIAVIALTDRGDRACFSRLPPSPFTSGLPDRTRAPPRCYWIHVRCGEGSGMRCYCASSCGDFIRFAPCTCRF